VQLAKDGTLRIYLAGSICVARGDTLVPESRLPGRQGRLAFAILAAERDRALAREEIAELLWGGNPPRAWDTALRAIVSKLRTALGEAGLEGDAIAGRPFLTGEESPWVANRRAALRDVRVRALECRAAVGLDKGLFALAARDAELVLELEPFRETAYQLLMRAHAGAGNPAEALRVYERCRTLIGDELGVEPSPQTEAMYLDILRSR